MNEHQRRQRGLEMYASQFNIDISNVAAYLSSTFGSTFAEEAIQSSGGAAWSEGSLPTKNRSLIVIAILASLGGSEKRLQGHVAWALRNGVTLEEIDSTILLVANYAGFARASTAQEIIREYTNNLDGSET